MLSVVEASTSRTIYNNTLSDRSFDFAQDDRDRQSKMFLLAKLNSLFLHHTIHLVVAYLDYIQTRRTSSHINDCLLT